MVEKVGDHGSFMKNIDKLQEAGYVSLRGRDNLSSILEAGHASIHRNGNQAGRI